MAASNEDFILLHLGYMIILPLIICIFGVISHVFLFIAFIKDPLKCFRNSGTYLVISLAVSDFVLCLVVPFSNHLPQDQEWGRNIAYFALVSTPTVSTLMISSISLDRFLLIVYPLKHRVLKKGKIVVLWLACVWLIGLALPFKETLFEVSNDRDPFVGNVLGIVLILLSSVMYAVSCYILKKQSKNLALENISDRQEQARLMKEKQFLRTIILIAGIAFACIVLAGMYFQYAKSKGVLNGKVLEFRILTGVFCGLYYVNYAVNPLVYVLRLSNYRKTFHLLYCCKATRRY